MINVLLPVMTMIKWFSIKFLHNPVNSLWILIRFHPFVKQKKSLLRNLLFVQELDVAGLERYNFLQK